MHAHKPFQPGFVSPLYISLLCLTFACESQSPGPQTEAAPAHGFSFIHNLESVYANPGLVVRQQSDFCAVNNGDVSSHLQRFWRRVLLYQPAPWFWSDACVFVFVS